MESDAKRIVLIGTIAYALAGCMSTWASIRNFDNLLFSETVKYFFYPVFLWALGGVFITYKFIYPEFRRNDEGKLIYSLGDITWKTFVSCTLFSVMLVLLICYYLPEIATWHRETTFFSKEIIFTPIFISMIFSSAITLVFQTLTPVFAYWYLEL